MTAAAADEEPICAAGPGLATPTCTVPVGMVQVETGFIDWTGDRSFGLNRDTPDLQLYSGIALRF